MPSNFKNMPVEINNFLQNEFSNTLYILKLVYASHLSSRFDPNILKRRTDWPLDGLVDKDFGE